MSSSRLGQPRLAILIAIALMMAMFTWFMTQRDSEQRNTGFPPENASQAGAEGNSRIDRFMDELKARQQAQAPTTVASTTASTEEKTQTLDLQSGEALSLPTVASENGRPDHDQAIAAVHAVETQVYDRADTLFVAEAVDYDWASPMEQEFNAMFSEVPSLGRVSVSDIECRATMCRILVFTPEGRDADYFTAVFYDALDRYGDGHLKSTAAIARNMANGITAVYVSRKNHTLKFYQ